MRPISECWLANTDVQLLVDVGKVADYMTKYVTKAEPMSADVVARMIDKLLESDQNTASTGILKRVMSQVLGQRPISRQECSHLINSLPIVVCSHDFVNCPMTQDTETLDMESTGGHAATTMSLLRAYGSRLDETKWGSKPPKKLDEMNFREFVGKFYVGKHGKYKGKIRRHQSQKKVIRLTPKFSHNKDGPNYAKYCKYALLQYRPWDGEEPNAAWPDAATANAEHIKDWEDYVKKLRVSGKPVPDQLSRAIRDAMIDRYAERRKNGRPAAGEATGAAGGEAEATRGTPGTAGGAADARGIKYQGPESDEEEEEWMALAGGALVSELAEESLLGDGLDPSNIMMKWDSNHDWSKLEETYPTGFKQSFPTGMGNIIKSLSERSQRPQEDSRRLNKEQKLAHDLIVRAVKRTVTNGPTGTTTGRLILLRGVGGTGKSFTINSTLTTLCQTMNMSEEDFLVMATTAKAASVVNGSTLHSAKEGLAVPISIKPYQRLKGRALAKFQNRLQQKKLVVLDEYSMLRPKELHYMNLRLQEALGNEILFGGLPVVLCGDPGQLPPVASKYALWSNKARNDDLTGCRLYKLFGTSVNLVENNRVDHTDLDSVFFADFLLRLRDGQCTREDWEKVKQTCSQSSMSDREWQARGFNNPDIPHLFCTNREVEDHNKKRLTAQGKPIVLIEAQHSEKNAKKLSNDYFWGLETCLYLCVNARVTVQINLCTPAGLMNGSEGIVKDIVYADSGGPTSQPKFVMVDFGTQYTGPSFFPDDPSRRGWVPICPFTATCQHQKPGKKGDWVELSRTMIPLRLSWAMTIWKSQGQTFQNKVVLSLGKTEPEHGATYVAFSRAKRLKEIGIVGGLTRERLCDKVAQQSMMQPRIDAEVRLNKLARYTMDYHDALAFLETVPGNRDDDWPRDSDDEDSFICMEETNDGPTMHYYDSWQQVDTSNL